MCFTPVTAKGEAIDLVTKGSSSSVVELGTRSPKAELFNALGKRVRKTAHTAAPRRKCMESIKPESVITLSALRLQLIQSFMQGCDVYQSYPQPNRRFNANALWRSLQVRRTWSRRYICIMQKESRSEREKTHLTWRRSDIHPPISAHVPKSGPETFNLKVSNEYCTPDASHPHHRSQRINNGQPQHLPRNGARAAEPLAKRPPRAQPIRDARRCDPTSPIPNSSNPPLSPRLAHRCSRYMSSSLTHLTQAKKPKSSKRSTRSPTPASANA